MSLNPSVQAPRLAGKWSVVYHLEDERKFSGRFTVEDADGMVVAVVPFGDGATRLGYVAAERVARAIARLPEVPSVQ